MCRWIFTSNVTKQRVFKALEAAIHVHHQPEVEDFDVRAQ